MHVMPSDITVIILATECLLAWEGARCLIAFLALPKCNSIWYCSISLQDSLTLSVSCSVLF